MKRQNESWTAWILVRSQIITANFDPEVLQWPGGSIVAACLWFYATVAIAVTGWHKHLGTKSLMPAH
jgi:hypothetical protein